ncbi:RmlC-like cupin [Bimuria novae-zelandiae CBS 107.79]|uniref:RmlC-like cupin n=1 Tax=Bimuria novae-zelandiae CBS 107.79 TaxID=1447943 RepID=A0A6A5VR67_9PLEO|nr:RmlC-like cupin [Bimuria novae-zelandiae CBS 107.79]
MVTITKTFLAAVALSAVQALPQQSLTTVMTPSTATATPAAAAPSLDPELKKALADATTEIERLKLLLTTQGQTLLTGEDLKKATVFDFNDAKPAKGAKGGASKAANAGTFPILQRLGISTTYFDLEPCGMNTPHVHPRASEWYTTTEGQIDFGYITENNLVESGNAEIAGTLKKYQGTVFPQGSIHYQINNQCVKAKALGTLNSADPGTVQAAQAFFGLNADVVNATLGFPKSINGTNIEEFRKYIPANLARSVDICLAKCKNQGYPTGNSTSTPTATAVAGSYSKGY